MPHRTVFQWGKNHVHPFTMFIGGFVIGALVTGVVAWAWIIANDTDIDIESVVKPKNGSPAVTAPKATATPEATPTATPRVNF